MNNKEWVFAIIFTISLVLSLYFLGSSITGHVVQSMFCQEGVCKQLCRFNTDCTGVNEVCCDKAGFGVCEQSSECDKEFEMGLEVDVASLPMLESPAPVKRNNIMLFSVITWLVLLVGILYFLGKKINPKRAVSKRRR